MLPKVPLWSISMLDNTIFEASSLGCQLFNKCDDLYHVMFRGMDWRWGTKKWGQTTVLP